MTGGETRSLDQYASCPPAPAAHYSIEVLHRFDVGASGTRIVLPGAAQRVVAFLCIEQTMRRDAICGRIWSELPESSARAALRNALWQISKRAPGLIKVAGADIELSADVMVDLWRLRDLAWDLVHPARLTAAERSRADLSILQRAELLPGWYEEWLDPPREELRQLQLHALESLAHAFITEQKIALALAAALEVTRLEPLRESAAAAVIAAHLAECNFVEALRHYRLFAARLRVELGVHPSASLAQLITSSAVQPTRIGVRRVDRA